MNETGGDLWSSPVRRFLSVISAGSEAGDQLEHFGSSHSVRCAKLAQLVADSCVKYVELGAVDGLHRRLKLALVRPESVELGVDRLTDVFDMIGLIGFPE
jgi:hypothetical protein